MLQQLDDLERQRRKPVFAERKIGKSISVNSHLGFPLKVLEELSERDELGSPQKQKKEKTPFFEQLRQQQQQLQQQRNNHHNNNNSSNINNHHGNGNAHPIEPLNVIPATPPTRPNRLLDNASARSVMQTKLDELRLPEHVDKFVANIKSPLEVDSGVGTPLSPPSTASNASNASSNSNSSSITTGSIFSRMGYKTTPASLSPLAPRQLSMAAIALEEPKPEPEVEVAAPPLMHPLSMVGGDVNVRFKGTTQLKSIRPVHHMRAITLPSTESEPGVVATAAAAAVASATAAAAAATATAATATGRS